MSIPKIYYKTAEAAELLRTSDVQLRAARGSGVLFGRPAPEFHRVGKKKILYKLDDLTAFVESAPKARITDTPEPEGLREAREG